MKFGVPHRRQLGFVRWRLLGDLTDRNAAGDLAAWRPRSAVHDRADRRDARRYTYRGRASMAFKTSDTGGRLRKVSSASEASMRPLRSITKTIGRGTP